jgi:hypothetical protein
LAVVVEVLVLTLELLAALAVLQFLAQLPLSMAVTAEAQETKPVDLVVQVVAEDPALVDKALEAARVVKEILVELAQTLRLVAVAVVAQVKAVAPATATPAV